MEATFSSIIDKQPFGQPPNYKGDHQGLVGSPSAPPQSSHAPAEASSGRVSAFGAAAGCDTARCHRTPFPTRAICPMCQSVTITETKPVVGNCSLMFGFLLCGLCLLPCVCIPCFTPKFMDVEHKCRSCKQKVGLFKRMY